MADIDLSSILNVAVKGRASDVHLKAGMRGMNEAQKEQFKEKKQVDMAYSVPGLGRFRVNIFQQRGAIGIVLRVIPIKIMTFEELNLPKILEKVSNEMRGLVLV